MEKKVLRGPDTMFYNSQAIIVEYEDILNTPDFNILNMLIHSKYLRDITKVDISPLEFMEMEDLVEWYMGRRYRNVFLNLIPFKIDASVVEYYDDITDNLLNTQLGQNIQGSPNIIRVLTDPNIGSLVKNIYVYINHNNEYSKNVVQQLLPNATILKNTFFSEAIEKISKDSTYILSDIDKIQALAGCGRLECASIIVPHGLRYNQGELGKEKPEIARLYKDHIFKLNYFNNFYEEISPEIKDSL